MKISITKNKTKLRKSMKKMKPESQVNLSLNQKYFPKKIIFKTNIKLIKSSKITKILIKRRKNQIKVKYIKNNKKMNKNHNHLKNKVNSPKQISQQRN